MIAHFDARGTASDGKPYVNRYAWILRLSKGKIVEAHAFFRCPCPSTICGGG